MLYIYSKNVLNSLKIQKIKTKCLQNTLKLIVTCTDLWTMSGSVKSFNKLDWPHWWNPKRWLIGKLNFWTIFQKRFATLADFFKSQIFNTVNFCRE